MTVSLSKTIAVLNADGSVAREFDRKSDATRYAKKHGLTVSGYDATTTLALVTETETLDASDIETLLGELEPTDPVAPMVIDETTTLRDIALGFGQTEVDDMVAQVRASFDRRDGFEAANGLSVTGDNSYTRERDRMVRNEIAVARLFLALGITASDVIERQVSSTSMFNAKALKKVTEIAQYTCGYGQRLEKVMRAFIACALVATDRGFTTITNEINRRFLNSSGFTSLFSDQELIDYLDSQSHRTMTSGAETQSSQARNVLDVLGLGSIRTVHKNRDAIEIDATAPFYAQFRKDFMK
jgi:hypothetical protein